jgi:hypothetical protein
MRLEIAEAVFTGNCMPDRLSGPSDDVPNAYDEPYSVRLNGGTSDAIRVIVPADPPTFTPESSRALLRLLLAVKEARESILAVDPSEAK